MDTEPNELRVFISWSGDRSKTVATALRVWLGQVTNGATYFMSDLDIEAGARWDEVISAELETGSFGVAVLTPESLESQWVYFECGALAKAMSTSRVIPYLVGFPTKSSVLGPLARFQAVPADREGTLKLIEAINKYSSRQLDGALLQKLFDSSWGTLEAVLNGLPTSPAKVTQPAPEEMLAAILDAVQFTQRLILPDQGKAIERVNPILR